MHRAQKFRRGELPSQPFTVWARSLLNQGADASFFSAPEAAKAMYGALKSPSQKGEKLKPHVMRVKCGGIAFPVGEIPIRGPLFREITVYMSTCGLVDEILMFLGEIPFQSRKGW